MVLIRFAPDPAPGGGTTPATPTDTHVRHHSNVPTKDADIKSVGTLVAAAWLANPGITLVWKTQAQFAADVASFTTALAHRQTAGGTRPQQTQALDNIDIQIEDAVPFVKSYINEKYGPANGPSYYAQFGMVHRHGHYELPTDHQQRSNALQMMIDAIHADGFDLKTYGATFWTGIKSSFDTALGATVTTDNTVSSNVSQLVVLRTSLRRVMHALLLVLEGNYPDTFDQVRRTWGFQVEDY
jgi:hypothetical protein